MNCKEKWGSVRKVRYLVDIFSTIHYTKNNLNEKHDLEKFLNEIIKGRIEREKKIVINYNKSSISTQKGIFNTHFSKTAPDTIVFMKNINVLKLNDSIIQKTEYMNLNGKDMHEYIIKNIIDSKYRAYGCLLQHLYHNNEILLRKDKLKRNKETALYLKDLNINTDVASFYTMRDLLYELGIINWLILKEGNMILFPTSTNKKPNDYLWQDKITLNNYDLYYNKLISEKEFESTLVKAYLKNANNKFNVEGDLIAIRDDVCYEFRISDVTFKNQLLNYYNLSDKNYQIRLNFGYMEHKKQNYNLKMLNLPQITNNQLALYLRMREVN